MDFNEVRLCGTIATQIAIDGYDLERGKFNPIKFTMMVGDCPVLCVADDTLAVAIQRRCMRGVRCLVVGEMIARYTQDGIPINGVKCLKVICESESGYLSAVRECEESAVQETAVDEESART